MTDQELTTSDLTVEAVHAFLRQQYKHDRFEGRNGREWGNEYSLHIAQDRLNDLERSGWSLISPYEAACGQTIVFNDRLEVTRVGERGSTLSLMRVRLRQGRTETPVEA